MKLFYDHEAYMRPLFYGGLIVAETILPVHAKGDSGELSIDLMNKIDKVVEVRKADRSEIFAKGADYVVRDGKLVIPEGSRIKVMAWEEYCYPEGGDPVFECVSGGNLRFHNNNEFHTMQYEVTYESADNCFEGKYVPSASPLLSKTREMLTNGEKVKLGFLGDSITYGLNASGLENGVAPYMPIYPRLLCETLEGRGRKIHYYNPSIGGMSTWWGAKVAAETLGRFVPDLAVIAFGMNDACKGGVEKDELIRGYIANTKKIIDDTRAVNPAAEFILVTTTLPNPIAKRFNRFQADLEQPIIELAKREGCAVLNMTDLHRTLMTRKTYHHMTGNNINHPSDFLARVYAQGIMALLGE